MYRYLESLLLPFFLLLPTLASAESPPAFGSHSVSQNSQKMVAVNWNTPEGLVRLGRISQESDFYRLAHFVSPQIYPSFCGIASSTIVLNGLRVPTGSAPPNPELEMPLPKVWGGKSVRYHLYTQETFFTKATDRVKTRDVIALRNITSENEEVKRRK